MSNYSIRRTQLIIPFGAGSLYEVDGQSFFIRGIGSWDKRAGNLIEIDVPSLAGRLGEIRGFKKPEKSVAVTRFPKWHFCPQCRRMRYWSNELDKPEMGSGAIRRPECDNPKCTSQFLVPMRFVAICDKGHLDEINWYRWTHLRSQLTENGPCDWKSANLEFTVTGKSGGDFESMLMSCDCGAENSLEGINNRPLPQRCEGRQPGETPKGCHDINSPDNQTRMWMEPRGSSALHFASIVSALDITKMNGSSYVMETLKSDTTFSNLVISARVWIEKGRLANSELRDELYNDVECTADELGVPVMDAWDVFEAMVLSDSSNVEVDPKEVSDHSQIFVDEFKVLGSSQFLDGPRITCKPNKPTQKYGLDGLFDKFVQVERLREVRVFRGFQRRDVSENNPIIKPDLDRQTESWLPAVEIFGEGIFLEFNSSALRSWCTDNGSAIRDFTIRQLVEAEKQGIHGRFGVELNEVFILVHTFAHVLINQLSFDCGYSSTSLRERIYCGPLDSLYAGVLVYTADSDSEGSMGGLAEMGDPDRISEVIYRSVVKSRWCSGDPVCRELEGQGMGGLNRAACHACTLVAETSCTYSNILLNRVLLTGDGRKNGRGMYEPRGYFLPVLER